MICAAGAHVPVAVAGAADALRVKRMVFRTEFGIRSRAFRELGPAARGAFGAALRESTCLTGAPSCQGCAVAAQCVYTTVFRPENLAALLPSTGLPAAPRYALQLSGLQVLGKAAEYQPAFSITLIGCARNHTAECEAALCSVRLWGRCEPVRSLEHAWAPAADGDGDATSETPIRVDLLSPLQLDRRAIFPARFDAVDLVRKLALRIRQKARFEGIELASFDFAQMANEVRLMRASIVPARGRAADVRGIDLRGLTGSLDLAMTTRWARVLQFGQYLNAGRHTSYGAGEFAVHQMDARQGGA